MASCWKACEKAGQGNTVAPLLLLSLSTKIKVKGWSRVVLEVWTHEAD